MTELYIKYKKNSVPIDTAFGRGPYKDRPLMTVGHVIAAFFPTKTREELSFCYLHLPEGVARSDSGLSDECFAAVDESDTALDPGCPLLSLGSFGTNSKQPLTIKVETQASYLPVNHKSASFGPGSSKDDTVISIWNSSENGIKLLAIPCRPHGRKWIRVQQFLFSVCGDFPINLYALKKVADDGSLSDLSLAETDLLGPGRYCLVPVNNASEPLHIKHTRFPLIPTGRNSKQSSASSTASTSSSSLAASTASAKKRIRNILADTEDSVLVEGCLDLYNRAVKFEKTIIALDNHCVVTGDFVANQACHILAHAWWGDFSNRKDSLPQDIRDIISGLCEGINDIRNGILLRADLAKSFDDGLFSFKYEDGHYIFIAISTAYEMYDGQQMDENLRPRMDGSTWSLENQPHRKLVEFHFRNSVFKHMKASEGVNDMEWSDDDDEEAFVARRRVEDFFDGSQVGESLARHITSDTLFEILSFDV